MNDGRPNAGFTGNGQANQLHPTIAPPLRPQPAGAGIGLRPQPVPGTPHVHAPVHPHAPAHPHAHAPAHHAPPPLPAKPIEDEPFPLEGEDEAKPTAEPPKSKIHQMSAGSTLAHHEYKRPTHSNKTGAVRMRTFHCRLSEQGVEYLDQTINDWLEHHPDFEVKFTTSTVGMWDGKLKEPTLIINVWY